MPTPLPLQILLDTAQLRLREDSISTLVSGEDWDVPIMGGAVNLDGVTDLFVEPILQSVILRPACFHPNWLTSNVAPFDKIPFSALSNVTDPANWIQPTTYSDGAPFYQHKGTNPGILRAELTALLGVNVGMVVGFNYAGNYPGGKYNMFEFGWNKQVDGTYGVSLRIYTDGAVEVWKNNVLVGSSYSISHTSDYYDPKTGIAGKQAKTQSQMSVLVLPIRDREMLVVSTDGGGFSHVFEDLQEGVAGQTILPAGKFGFDMVAPHSVDVRIAYAKFAKTSGKIRGATTSWRLTPPPTGLFTRIFAPATTLSGSIGGTSSVAVLSGAATRNPQGIASPIQLEFTLSGSATATPVIYGGRAWYGSQKASTPAVNTDVSPFVRSCHLSVSDTIGGTSCEIEMGSPAAIGTLGSPGLTSQCARPIRITAGTRQILDGLCDPPQWSWQTGFDVDGRDRLQRIELKARDVWKRAEEYVFADPVPLDGMKLADAYMMVADMMGLSATVSPIQAAGVDFVIPSAGAQSKGGWNMVIEPGDRGSEWLERLHHTYCADFAHYVDPFGTLLVKDPTTFSTVSALTLYPTVDAAVLAGVSPSLAPNRVWRSYKRTVLQPEANDVWVVGVDKRTQRPLFYHRRDAASIDPTTTVAARPANWLGNLIKYSWMDPAITTPAAAQFALNHLYPRLTAARVMIEFECEFQESIWRYDLVTLVGTPISDGDIRIKTFTGSFDHTDPLAAVWRPCRYVGEAGPLVCPLGVPGATVEQIAASWGFKTFDDSRKWAAAVFASGRPTLSVTNG